MANGGDALAVEIDDGVMDGLVERGDVREGLVGEVMGFKIASDRLDFIEFRGVFGSRSTVSQCARAARAAIERLLVWIGPLSSTSTTGLACRPGCGPKRRSSCSRCAMKSMLRLVGCVSAWKSDPLRRGIGVQN
jgi:hypothetical protein